MRIRNRIFEWWNGFRDWVNAMDSCEICGNEKCEYICVGCNKRICGMCDSGYYADAELCVNCRKDISPEEEAEDCKDNANDLKEQCTCPETEWTGSAPNDSTCELTEEEHEYIRKYADKDVQA